jgi:hypothetical protein
MFLSSLKTSYRPTDGQTGILHKEYMKKEQNKMGKRRKGGRKFRKG